MRKLFWAQTKALLYGINEILRMMIVLSTYQSLNVLPVAHAGQLFRYFLTCRPGKRLGSLQKQLMEYRYRYIKKI
jgi:hypothetical protein